MWIDDATQDVALACWRANDDGPTVVYRKARDAARRYGPRSRRGVSRETAPLSPYQRAPDALNPIVEAMAARQCFARLTAKQRAALIRRIKRLPMSSLDSQHATAARRNMRRLLAG